MSRYKDLLAQYDLLEDCYKEHVKQSDQKTDLCIRNSTLEMENSMLRKENERLIECSLRRYQSRRLSRKPRNRR